MNSEITEWCPAPARTCSGTAGTKQTPDDDKRQALPGDFAKRSVHGHAPRRRNAADAARLAPDRARAARR